MLELLDQQKSLTINQWKIFTACLFSIVIDFFDFGLIGFVLAFFVKDWHLTFGQSGGSCFPRGWRRYRVVFSLAGSATRSAGAKCS